MSSLTRWALSARNAGLLCGLFSLGLGQSMAGTLCVNPGGTSNCYTTIGAAVKAAATGDTIKVASGEYVEGVVLSKPLSLVGAGAHSTIINAKGQPNGIYLDGLDNAGLTNVLVTGFTITSANFEGILVTNTTNSLITNNHVTGNDQSLNYATGTWPGVPIFETNEGLDCGEGVHLVGAFAVTVTNNEVDLNSGGILLSDETGQTYENLIVANSVHDNALDCVITLASHAPSPQASSKLPYGVVNNNIVGNNVAHNGLIGQGAGIGVFAPGPGNLGFGNKIIGNTIEGNGLPGVTIHNHAAPPGAPGINLNTNMIVGNFISGNGADQADAATPGTAGINVYSVGPVYLTQILQNTITNQDIDVVMNYPGTMDVHMNNLLGGKVGIQNLGAGAVDATMNYFGCAAGPGNTGCGSVKGSNVTSTPFSSAPVSLASPPKQ